jgi:hypothetical protein
MRAKSDAHGFMSAAVRGLPDVTPKRMFGADAFFIRQRMFAFLLDDVIVLKLPEAQRREVIGAKLARPFLTGENAPFGRWVEVGLSGPDGAGTARAFQLVQAAYQLAQTPDREGPRKRRTVGKRRKPAKKVSAQ